jgi:CheY-like chemotaxis protein
MTTHLLNEIIYQDENNRVYIAAVSDGEEAVESCKKKRFELILMDIHMGQVNGYEATARIRKIEQASDLTRCAIVGLTGDDDAHVPNISKEVGMNDVLHKPINPALLMRVLTQHGFLLKMQPKQELMPGAVAHNTVGGGGSGGTSRNVGGTTETPPAPAATPPPPNSCTTVAKDQVTNSNSYSTDGTNSTVTTVVMCSMAQSDIKLLSVDALPSMGLLAAAPIPEPLPLLPCQIPNNPCQNNARRASFSSSLKPLPPITRSTTHSSAKDLNAEPFTPSSESGQAGI